MRRMLLRTVIGAAMIAGGCATALNLQDETSRRNYGGVLMAPGEFFGGGDAGDLSAIMFWPLWLLDKPLSLFGDTVALPYTLWVSRDPSPPAKGPSADRPPLSPPDNAAAAH